MIEVRWLNWQCSFFSFLFLFGCNDYKKKKEQMEEHCVELKHVKANDKTVFENSEAG